MKTALLFLIEAYQDIFRPSMGAHCRFWPSCADYAHEAVSRHGALKGSTLSLWRLMKCHPLHAGGVDPVPTLTRHG